MTGAWYVGVDPASSDAGVAAFNEDGELRTTAIRVRGQVPTRLAKLRAEIRACLQFVAEDGAWCVVVERPAAHHGGPTLLAAYGVAVEAAASLLPKCAVLTLRPDEVDEAVALKRIPGVDRKTLVRARARVLGYDGDSQDVADAVVCAHAARVLTQKAVAA